MNKSKVIKVLVCLAACILIVINLLNLFGVVSFNKSQKENLPGEVLATFLRENIGTDDYSFCISIHENNMVYVDVFNSKYSTNSFYPIDELENCTFKSRIINWGFQYSEQEDVYASVVPQNCKCVQIDGKTYMAETINISTDTKDFYVKVVITTLNHRETHELIMIDEQNKQHHKPLI